MPSPQESGEVSRVVEHYLNSLTATYWPRLTWGANVGCPYTASKAYGTHRRHD